MNNLAGIDHSQITAEWVRRGQLPFWRWRWSVRSRPVASYFLQPLHFLRWNRKCFNNFNFHETQSFSFLWKSAWKIHKSFFFKLVRQKIFTEAFYLIREVFLKKLLQKLFIWKSCSRSFLFNKALKKAFGLISKLFINLSFHFCLKKFDHSSGQ